MSPNDGLPPRICDSCATRLLEAYILRQQIERSHRSLMDIRQQDPDANNIEIIEDVMIVFKKGSEKDVEVYNVKTIKEPSARKIKSTKPIKSELAFIDIPTGDLNEAKEDDEEDGVSFLLSLAPDTSANETEPTKVKAKKRVPSKTHECSVCNKKFTRKSNLVDHLRLHANMRPYECEVCHVTFVQTGNLRAHMRIHTKERPYECNICGKTYNQSGALKVHIRNHTNERNFKCETCGKAFTNASDRNKHSRVHDENSHFKCTECHKSFAQRVNWKLHMDRYHKNKTEGASPSKTKSPISTKKEKHWISMWRKFTVFKYIRSVFVTMCACVSTIK